MGNDTETDMERLREENERLRRELDAADERQIAAANKVRR